ncbi:hypothetical protein ON010_g12468 [Phytophthora cinnamomi]|nr:hypothetical protein ON010_g12468 [Phytophthora cinnamomi]
MVGGAAPLNARLAVRRYAPRDQALEVAATSKCLDDSTRLRWLHSQSRLSSDEVETVDSTVDDKALLRFTDAAAPAGDALADRAALVDREAASHPASAETATVRVDLAVQTAASLAELRELLHLRASVDSCDGDGGVDAGESLDGWLHAAAELPECSDVHLDGVWTLLAVDVVERDVAAHEFVVLHLLSGGDGHRVDDVVSDALAIDASCEPRGLDVREVARSNEWTDSYRTRVHGPLEGQTAPWILRAWGDDGGQHTAVDEVVADAGALEHRVSRGWAHDAEHHVVQSARDGSDAEQSLDLTGHGRLEAGYPAVLLDHGHAVVVANGVG